MTEYGGGNDTHRPEIPSSAGWATFEARVRGRRFARCVERAHAAIDFGDLDGARDAVSEARALMPDAPEISDLEARIASRPTAVDIPTFVEMPPFEADPGWPRVIGAMVVLLLLFGLFGFGLAQLYFTRPAQQLLSAGSSPVDNELVALKDKQVPPADGPRAEPPATKAAAPESPAATTGLAATPAPKPTPPPPSAAESRRTMPAQETPARPATQARLGNARPEISAPPPRSNLSTTNRATPTTRAPAVEPPAISPAPPSTVRPPERSTTTTPATDNAPAPVAALPTPPPAAAPTPAVADTSGATLKPLDSPVPASRESPSAGSRAEESARIRLVLLRYESAYNRLDATAASSIWPAVDEAALDRAFKGLLSQRVSLGLCDITVIGDIGGASCVGKARWEPRVGGGVQTADRHWTFNLRKSGDSWKIEQIRVR